MDFVGDRAEAYLTLSMFFSALLHRPFLPLSDTLPVFINFFSMYELGRGRGSLPYLVLYFR